MSGVLLDTNALLWLLTGSPRLGESARATLEGANEVHYSAVAILELSMKEMLGRLPERRDTLDAVRAAGLTELPFRGTHASAVTNFPELVRHDPFDRMLLAQAQVEGLELLTSDRALQALAYPWVVDARL